MVGTDTFISIGNLKLDKITKIVPTEKLDKKWQVVVDRPQPSTEETETLTMLNERFGLAKEAKQRKHDVWNQSYLQYRSVNHYSLIYGGFPTYWNQWGMSVFIPRTFETIESIKTQIMGRRPDFSVEPTRPSQASGTANLGYLLKSEYRRSKTQVEVAETIHDALLYGSGLVRTDFLHSQESQYVMSWNDDGSIKYDQQLVTTYSGVGSRRVDPYDFYPNPSVEAYRMDKLGWAFERSMVDAWDLREQYRHLRDQEAYGVTDNWQYIKPGGDVSDYKYLRSEIDNLYIHRNDERTPGTVNDLIGRTGLPSSDKIPVTSKNKIEVLEYWENDRYIVIANGLILRDSPNPYPHKQIPYVKFSVVDMNEFWSMGMPEIMKWLQIEENVLHDQGLNNIIMSVHKMFAVNSRYLEDEGELVVRPFGIVHLKQIPNVRIQDAIMPIEYNMNMTNYFEFMRMTQSNIQTVTGVSPYMTGGVTKEAKVERATVANRLSFAGQARIREIARHAEDSLVVGIVEQYVAIAQFYYQNASAIEENSIPVEVEAAGSNYYLKFLSKKNGEISETERALAKQEGYQGIISGDEIQGRYKVIVNGGSTLAKDPEETARLKLEFFTWAKDLMVTTQSPGTDPTTGQPMMVPSQIPMFDIKKLGKEVVRDTFEVSNPDDYFYKPEMEAGQSMITSSPSSPTPPMAKLAPIAPVPPEFGGKLPPGGV